MTEDTDKKIGLILLGMGGPSKLDDVREYLYNIFSDRNIIRLPFGPLFQKPFAKMIAKRRYEKVQSHYELIGGSSPLLKWTEAQKENIEFTLSPILGSFNVYIGMRYFHPLTDEAIRKAYEDGCRKLFFLPMYPQYCKATTGSSFIEAKKAVSNYNDMDAVYIDGFHDNSGYISLLKEYIDKNIKDDETLLFSAHSIPQSFVDEGDPYVDQTKKTAKLASGDREYYLSFQSRTGPVKWVGPDTVAEVKRLVETENRKLFIVPISFICDHIETLFEIDIELKDFINSKYHQNIRRMPMFNDDKSFGSVLADLVLEKIKENG